MTRINLIPPQKLLDQHLLAEYRELPRVAAYLRKSLARDGRERLLARIPAHYVLGTGHVTFFYNKGAFLHARYEALVAECLARGIHLQKVASPDAIWQIFMETDFYQPWQPQRAEIALNVARLTEKLRQKPDFYRFHGKKLSAQEVADYLQRLASR